MHERMFSAALADRLDRPERQLWLPPEQVLAQLKVKAGEVVVDLGAGTGYFTLPLSQAVGDKGTIYAVDAQAEMLTRLQQKLEAASISNVRAVLATAEATGLPARCADLILLANIWHEFEDHAAVLDECRRILRGDGRIAILDWRTDVEPDPGPPVSHRIPVKEAESVLLAAGYRRPQVDMVGPFTWMVQSTC